jgi:hypothetical protein
MLAGAFAICLRDSRSSVWVLDRLVVVLPFRELCACASQQPEYVVSYLLCNAMNVSTYRNKS